MLFLFYLAKKETLCVSATLELIEKGLASDLHCQVQLWTGHTHETLEKMKIFWIKIDNLNQLYCLDLKLTLGGHVLPSSGHDGSQHQIS